MPPSDEEDIEYDEALAERLPRKHAMSHVTRSE